MGFGPCCNSEFGCFCGKVFLKGNGTHHAEYFEIAGDSVIHHDLWICSECWPGWLKDHPEYAKQLDKREQND